MSAIGYIHSYESMGLLDGPGLRYVVFMQGCAIRCLYCHNPDTWEFKKGMKITAEELTLKVKKLKPYFKKSGGGVTFSGGEPLMQPDFLVEALSLCQKEGIHTAIDTAGVGSGKYEEIFKHTDLVILDVKHTDPNKYNEITGVNKNKVDEFIQELKKSDCEVWVKTVIVPGINDTPEFISSVREEASKIPNVKKMEFIPYHILGVNKYAELGIEYPLKDVPPMNKEKLKEMTC